MPCARSIAARIRRSTRSVSNSARATSPRSTWSSRRPAGVDAIIHSAGTVGAWGRIEDYYETNVRGTDNVLAACELHEIDKLVLTSSPSVVHDGADLEGVDESVPYATHFSSPYAQTKALAEQRVLAANGDAAGDRRAASAFHLGTGRSEPAAAHPWPRAPRTACA